METGEGEIIVSVSKIHAMLVRHALKETKAAHEHLDRFKVKGGMVH